VARKKNIDLSGLNEQRRKELENLPEEARVNVQGVGGDDLVEPLPTYIKAKNEVVIEGKNNTSIVLGRDRPSNRLSGYGGIGDTQAGSIDIVVGRMSPTPRDGVFVDPNFRKDAARIHISQKTDIDSNFGIAPGKAPTKTAQGVTRFSGV
jgi:hypothetical protein